MGVCHNAAQSVQCCCILSPEIPPVGFSSLYIVPLKTHVNFKFIQIQDTYFMDEIPGVVLCVYVVEAIKEHRPSSEQPVFAVISQTLQSIGFTVRHRYIQVTGHVMQ